MPSLPSPFKLSGTSDEAGAVVIQCGIDPAWAEGFRDGVEAVLMMLESQSPQPPDGDDQ
jgi:hypothetical protein